MRKILGEFIEECESFHDVCLETAAYCLEQGDAYSNVNSLATFLNCAEIFGTFRSFAANDPALLNMFCIAYIDACEECAKFCESFDDPQMKKCAAKSRRLIRASKKMLQFPRISVENPFARIQVS